MGTKSLMPVKSSSPTMTLKVNGRQVLPSFTYAERFIMSSGVLISKNPSRLYVKSLSEMALTPRAVASMLTMQQMCRAIRFIIFGF